MREDVDAFNAALSEVAAEFKHTFDTLLVRIC